MGLLSSLPAKGVAALVLAGVVGASYWYAYQLGDTAGTNAILVKQQAETIRKLSERVAANSALADRYRLDAEKAVSTHEKELADIRALAKRNAHSRVQIDANQFCRTASGSEAAKTGSAGPGDTGTAFLPEQFTSDLRELAAKADEVTANYRTLRERSATCFN